VTDLEPHADSVPPAPAEVLALLGASSHRLIDEVLTSAGLIHQGEQRWASSKGSLFKEFGAPYELVLTPLQVVAGDWLPERRLDLGEIFTEAHHHGDQVAAAADLLLAARGDGSSSPAARSLPPWLLNEVRRLAPQPVGPVVQTSVVAEPPAAQVTGSSGRFRAIAADSIEIVRQRWLWEGMLPIGTVCLLAGREAVGKSTCSLALAAETTRGGLPGDLVDVPRNVMIVATEDSWSTTIVPRLMAAGADLSKVFRLSTVTEQGQDSGAVTLPGDLEDFEALVVEGQVALVILDPLMSRLSDRLDSHCDGAVRQALEPLVAIAERTGACILGLIHVNKSQTTDAMNSVMASRAFGAVARSVLFVIVDPDKPQVRYLQVVKSNLGSTDLATMTFTIEPVQVLSDSGETLEVGRTVWGVDSSRTVREILVESAGPTTTRITRVDVAKAWLEGELQARGGQASRSELLSSGQAKGFPEALVKRARGALGLTSSTTGTYPNRTVWSLPDSRE